MLGIPISLFSCGTTGSYNTASPELRLRKRKYYQCVGARRTWIVERADPRRGDRHVLLAVFPLICNGDGMGAIVEFSGPEFLAGLGIKRAEAVVVGSADKHQTAGSRDGTSHVQTAGVLLARGKL